MGRIGTPDDAIQQIPRLVDQSDGGFGSYILLQHDWADWARSAPSELDAENGAAIQAASDTYAREKATSGQA
jgi:limonene 1,2-monooxygenase